MLVTRSRVPVPSTAQAPSPASTPPLSSHLCAPPHRSCTYPAGEAPTLPLQRQGRCVCGRGGAIEGRKRESSAWGGGARGGWDKASPQFHRCSGPLEAQTPTAHTQTPRSYPAHPAHTQAHPGDSQHHLADCPGGGELLAAKPDAGDPTVKGGRSPSRSDAEGAIDGRERRHTISSGGPQNRPPPQRPPGEPQEAHPVGSGAKQSAAGHPATGDITQSATGCRRRSNYERLPDRPPNKTLPGRGPLRHFRPTCALHPHRSCTYPACEASTLPLQRQGRCVCGRVGANLRFGGPPGYCLHDDFRALENP